MKTHKFLSGLLLFIGILIITSCSIEKRQYMAGYYIGWQNGKQNHKQNDDNIQTASKIIQNKEITLDQQDENLVMTASNNENELFVSKKNLISIGQIKKEKQEIYINKSEECDVIILKNGQEIKAKVSDIGDTEIKYKKCDNLTGPSMSINKSEVFMIQYPNGTKDVINTKQKNNDVNSDNNSASNEHDRSWVIALLLCFFFGVMGIHRLYLGYIGIGIIQLLTLGGCGLWALIDLIMILTHGLKPKNGKYKD